jgi:two-component system cell cycle sensor histidine kinase PleC
MLRDAFSGQRANSLMSEYGSLIGESILRKRTRTAEDAARIEAELSNRIRSEFIANMSHELRTPLNTVLGFSKLIAEHDRHGLPNGKIVEYAGLIRDAASHLLEVINGILDISKLQSGKYTLDSREVALDEVLSSCVEAFQPMAADAGVGLSVASAELPLIAGDTARLHQVFTNLITNAVKFTPAGGSVKVEAMPAGEGGVVVFVRDTGVGMTEEEIRIALTPFGQADAGRARWREGTGLGLPIAIAIVDLHGGHLGIRSSKGIGTEVGVMLPARCRTNKAGGPGGEIAGHQ